MKVSDIDWRYIHKPVLAALLLLSVGGAAWFFSQSYTAKAKAGFSRIDKLNKSIKSKIFAIQNDLRVYNESRKYFRELMARGIINKEQRLEWVARFRDISQAMKIRTARYEIEARKPVKRTDIDATPVRLFVSRMKINLEVLHENDFLGLLDAFNKAPGLFHASNCRILMKDKKISLNPAGSNLTVYCDIDWYSIHTNTKPTTADNL